MNEFKFNPEIGVSDTEAAQLGAMMGHPGFKVWLKISRSCADRFITHLLEAEDTDDNEIITRYRIAKIASQLLTMQCARMENIVGAWTASRDNDKPVDSAQGLDLGITAQEEIENEETGEEPLFYDSSY